MIKKNTQSYLSADILDTLNHDIIDYLDGISDPEKPPPNDGTRTKTNRPTDSAPTTPPAL